jgi:spore coat polysaccharide biosynthesis predicted glycosyltransferase SpsG
LRPEFAKYRGQSLSRREYPELKRILISMGGVDKDNVTGRVLTKIAQELLPLDLEVEVVLGAVSPHIESVLEQAGRMTCPMNINVDVSDIARRMADSDLAIAATGSSSWERCCLGLPSIAIITAANQVGAGRSLDQAGAVRLLFMSDIETELIGMFRDFMANGDRLTAMTKAASGICDGLGADRVAHALRSSI